MGTNPQPAWQPLAIEAGAPLPKRPTAGEALVRSVRERLAKASNSYDRFSSYDEFNEGVAQGFRGALRIVESCLAQLTEGTPAEQAAAWAASCEALDAASATERLVALHRVMDATVDDLERAELVPDDYQYTPRLSIGEFRILTGNLEFRAGMTGSLDTPAAHFIVTTSDDDDPGIAMERTTTDLGQVRAWLMSWTVGAR